MTATFEKAVEILLANEGGWSDDARDSGRATNRGITIGFYRSIHPDATADDLRHLSLEDTKAIYQKYFWDNTSYPKIISQAVANICLDSAANAGIAETNKIVQRALNSVLGQYDALIVDGILGYHSLAVLNRFLDSVIVPAIRSERAGFYRAVVAAHPNDIVFLDGWMKRSYST